MDHLFFIAAAYGVSLLGLGLLTGWTFMSYRHEQRTLAELDARGLRRRARPAASQDPARGSASRSDPLVEPK